MSECLPLLVLFFQNMIDSRRKRTAEIGQF